MILDTAGDLTTYGWIVSSGYHQIGTRGGGANNSGYPQIFCRTDSVPGCTIQFGASGQRLDVVDYAWTVDLLLIRPVGQHDGFQQRNGEWLRSFAGALI